MLVEHERRRHRDDEIENERVQLVELGRPRRIHVVIDAGSRTAVELGGFSLQVPDNLVASVGALGSSREDQLLDRAFGRPIGDKPLMSDVTASVAVRPPVVDLVVKTDVTVHLESPESVVVVVPPVANLSSREGRAEPLEAAVVAGVSIVQAAGERLTAIHTSGLEFEHVRHEAAEIRRTVSATLHLSQLTIEVVVLCLGVGTGPESGRVAIALLDGDAGWFAVQELLAVRQVTPALAGIRGEVQHGRLQGFESHCICSFVLIQNGRKFVVSNKGTN